MSQEENFAKVFDLLRDLADTTTRIDERTKRAEKIGDDHEQRIKKLEFAEQKRSGFIAAISLLASLIGAGVSWLASKIFGGQ